MKKIIAALLMICVFCGALCGCQAEKGINADDAIKIVAEDLGDRLLEASAPHVHEGTYNEKPCYNVYFSLDDESMLYVISAEDGEILYKGEGSHSH